MMKKLIALLLAVAALAALVGCGTKSDSGTETDAKIPEGPLGKYEPAITMTSVRDIPNPAIVKYPEGDDVENNVWIRSIKEELGIDVQYEWTVDSSQYANRLNTMMASKQFPDFFYLTAGQYKLLAEEGMLADLTDIYDQYASEGVKRVYNEGGPEALKSAKINNRLMGLPWISMAKEDVQMLWIRTDWLENLDMEIPKTMDELIDVAIAFATKDPDGNGKNDTFGIPVNGNTTGGLMWHKGFYNGYGSYPFAWIKKEDGSLVYGSIQPETKKALQQLQKLYQRKDSTVELEFINKTYFSLYDRLATGKYGIVFGPYYMAISPLQGVRTRNEKAEWVPLPLLSEKAGVIAKPQTAVDVAGYWVASKDCKHPEAVMKLTNFWYDKFYFNNDPAVYEKFVNGPEFSGIYNNSPIISYRSWNNVEAYNDVSAVLKKKKDAEELNPIAKDYYNQMMKFKDGDNECWNAQKCYDAVTEVISVYRDQNLFQNDMSYFTLDDLAGQKLAVLQKKEREYFTKIIMGEYSIDKFDEYVADFNRLGGKEITEKVNQWFREKNK